VVRLKLSSRQADDPVLRLQFGIIIAPVICDRVAAKVMCRFWRHPHIGKARLRQPGLDPLDRSGTGDAATQEGWIRLQLGR
jgi:hypothetical protein